MFAHYCAVEKIHGTKKEIGKIDAVRSQSYNNYRKNSVSGVKSVSELILSTEQKQRVSQQTIQIVELLQMSAGRNQILTEMIHTNLLISSFHRQRWRGDERRRFFLTHLGSQLCRKEPSPLMSSFYYIIQSPASCDNHFCHQSAEPDLPSWIFADTF